MVTLATLVSCSSLEDSLPKPGESSVADGEQQKHIEWPAAPEKARYRLSAVLVGEQTVTGKSSGSNTLTDFARAIAGIATGEKKYRVLQRPTSGLTLADGSVLVVDAGLKALVRFDFAKKEFAIWDQSGDNRGFKSPIAVVQDGEGGYLVSDSELARVIRLGKDGKPRGEFGAGALSRPTGLARDPNSGAIFVADFGPARGQEVQPVRRVVSGHWRAGRGSGPLQCADLSQLRRRQAVRQ